VNQAPSACWGYLFFSTQGGGTMESIAQKVRRCRKIRLERWTLLFFNKIEREHPGTRLEVMLEVADFWKDEKNKRKNQEKLELQKNGMPISGRCVVNGISTPTSVIGFSQTEHTSAPLKLIKRVKHNERGKVEADLFCLIDSQGDKYYISKNQCTAGMRQMIEDTLTYSELNKERYYYLSSRHQRPVYI
jgi:hypothetical protein